MIDTVLVGLIGATLIFGQLGRISLGNGVQFYALELLVLVHVIVLLFRYVKQSLRGVGRRSNLICLRDVTVTSRKFILSRVEGRQSHIGLRFLPTKGGQASINPAMTTIRKIVILWFIYVITLLFFTAWGRDFSDNMKAAMYTARVGLFALYFYLLRHTNISKQFVQNVVWVISVLIPSVCLMQYVLIPDLRFLAQLGWDPHMYRAVGLILDPPVVGVILGVLLFVTLRQVPNVSRMLDKVGTQSYKTAHFIGVFKNCIPVVLNFFAIIFLFSRSTYIATGLTIFLYFAIRKRYLYAMLWLVILGVLVYFAPKTIPPYLVLESAKIERVSTVMSRKVEIQNGLKAWVSHPIFGIGYNRVSEYKRSLPTMYGKDVVSNHSSSAFHSFWLTQLASTGVIGFALLVGAYVLLMKRSLYWALVLTIPALVGLLDNVVFHPFILTLFTLAYFSNNYDRSNSHVIN